MPEARALSDIALDLLVIEPEVKSRRTEFVRLREALGNVGVPIDLIVVPTPQVDEWGHFEGTMLNDALQKGRVLVQPEASPVSSSSSRRMIRVRAAGSSPATTSHTRSRSTPK
jgi:hypothetical protein